MKEMVFEWLICILCASVLMIIHEMVKTAIYLLQKRRMHQKAAFSHSMWAVYRYIDPIGLILAVVSNVPFSKPFMFRVRDKKTNLVMGISGFCILVAVFAFCICSLHLICLDLTASYSKIQIVCGQKELCLQDNIWQF